MWAAGDPEASQAQPGVRKQTPLAPEGDVPTSEAS
jgi:hypothetical protein